jgi:hypothetical protein
MAVKIDYYASLSRAIAGLDRDAYAARGAVYDREHKALMRRLFSADPPAPDEEIEREQRAFRAAVRRIEFGDEEIEIPLVPQREAAEEESLSAAELRAGEGSASRTGPVPPLREPSKWLRPPKQEPSSPLTVAREGAVDTSLDVLPASLPDAAPAPSVVSPDAAPEPVALLTRRPIAGRVFRRALVGAVLLGLGAIGYNALTGSQIPLVQQFSKTQPVEPSPAPPPAAAPALEAAPAGNKVVLFDGNRPDPNATQFAGTATWSLRFEPGASAPQGSPVVGLDLAVPGRKIVLTVTMRREPASSAMSHLFEFRFLGDDREPDPDIVNMASVFMTTAEMARPDVLVGQVVSVTPGVFLFGLSGEASARERNLRSLRDLTWMGIPIAYRNGASGLLVIEKGADGERAINEALRQ